MVKLGRIGAAALVLGSAILVAAAAPERYALPPEIRHPEGVAYDSKARAIYTVGSGDGTIARIDARTGAVTTIAVPGLSAQAGSAPPAALGIELDSRGRLWIAGGRTGKIFVVDPRSGRLLQTISTPDAASGFINDLAIVSGRAFFTDTRRPTLWSVTAGAEIGAIAEPWLDFTATPLRYIDGANLNGIVATPDGKKLIVGHMGEGLLYAIDLASRAVAPIELGGETLEGADGLVLDGRTLYVVRQPAAEIATVRLSPDLARGQVVARAKLPSLRWPATAAIVGRELVVANTQFNKRRTGDPELPFTLERVPLATLAPR